MCSSDLIGPKLLYTLPCGLGIYESQFRDIFNSNICFGGPHKVFTEAYSRAGISTAHIQTMLTQTARSYLYTPRTFIKAEIDSHGPFEGKCIGKGVDSYFNNELDLPTCDLPPLNTCFTQDPSVIIDVEPQPPAQEKFDGQVVTNKAMIPLSKLKPLQDEDDIPHLINTRCDACLNCPNCKASARDKTKSVQEAFEQEVLEKTVRVDLEQNKVWVNLPFIQDPVAFLTEKHKGNSNFYQAQRV